MKSIMSTVEQLLTKKGINYIKEYNGLYFELDGDVETYEMEFNIYEEDQYVILFVELAETIPENQRSTAAEFIIRVNNDKIGGDFKLDMDEGYVRYRVSNLLDRKTLTAKMFDKILNGAIGAMDFRYPGFMAICYEEASAIEATKIV